jgi:hypothetical protein
MRHAINLALGAGTRLWPWSRSAQPKQLLPLIGGETWLQIAYGRLKKVVPDLYRAICSGKSPRNLTEQGHVDMLELIGFLCFNGSKPEIIPSRHVSEVVKSFSTPPAEFKLRQIELTGQ